MLKGRLPPDPLLRELNELLTARGVDEAASSIAEAAAMRAEDAAASEPPNESSRTPAPSHDRLSAADACAADAGMNVTVALRALDQMLSGIQHLDRAPRLHQRSAPRPLEQSLPEQCGPSGKAPVSDLPGSASSTSSFTHSHRVTAKE